MKKSFQYFVFFIVLASSFPSYAKIGFYLNGDVSNIELHAGVVELNFTGELSHHSGIRIDVKDVKVIFPFNSLVCDSTTGKKATEKEFKECFVPKYKILVISMPSAILEFDFDLESIRSEDSKIAVYRDAQ